MNIRWRLVILAVQLAILSITTALVTGSVYAVETWYGAGMLSLIINPQILEPHYPRPGDVVGNSLIALVLYATATKLKYPDGWVMLAIFLLIALGLGLTALIFGAGRSEGKLVRLGRAANLLSRVATSRVIFSAVFVLALLEFRKMESPEFWLLAGTWALVTLLGLINWQAVWSSLSGAPTPCAAEGMIGPSLLLLTAPHLPKPGTAVELRSDGCVADGVVLNRIHRNTDFWGEIHIDDLEKCEQLARKSIITLSTSPRSSIPAVGAVLAPSSDTQLQFVSNRDLEVGGIVVVNSGAEEILYQIRWAEIEDAKVKGGAHQVVRAHASQLGLFDPTSFRLTRHRWVPRPGGGVRLPRAIRDVSPALPTNAILLGALVGTDIPVAMDCQLLCQGHLAILGMTRMGKTTLALRLAQFLAESHRVTILDQTGEWVSKKGLPRYATVQEDESIGISVLEPKPGTTPADEALSYLQTWVKLAYKEYRTGTPLPRVLIIDEAHQFVPEPAGMGFNSPGRESASKFGLLMMQIRKYGITVILISQRTAVVAKSALSQCENLIAFKSVDQTGLEYLEAILGMDARKALPALRHGEALVFGPAVSADLPAVIAVAQ
jgi:hypothetical protein